MINLILLIFALFLCLTTTVLSSSGFPPPPHLPRLPLKQYYEATSSTPSDDGPTLEAMGKNPYVKTYIDHFSSSTTDTSTFLHSQIRSLPPNSTLSYTVTSSPSFSILSYASSPTNSPYITISPLHDLDDDTLFIAQRVFVQSKKRDGPGQIGVEIKFGGWEVVWRGVEMKVYIANWLENGWNPRSQSHIFITSLPKSLTPPIPSPFLTSIPTNPSSTSDDTTQQTDEPVSILGLSPEQISDLFILEVSSFNSLLGNAVFVFDQGTWRTDNELWDSIQKASWDDVILDPKLKSSLKHEYKSFFASEAVYKELGVPWKRGIIFLGPPGNGKTITLKATMKDADVPILYVKSFKTFAGDQAGIRWIFTKARQQSPCLLVFEDLDSMITDVNRSFFLNEVDGLEDNDGLLMIATTNHFDKLDPALSNRPSRFDRKYSFDNPTTSERRDYATYWQIKLAPQKTIKFPDSLADTFVNKTDDFSFAYMKEAFIATLLLLAGDEEHKFDFGETLLLQVDELRKEMEKEKLKVMADTHEESHHDEERLYRDERQMVFEMEHWDEEM